MTTSNLLSETSILMITLMQTHGAHDINNISTILNLSLLFFSLSGLYRSELSLVTGSAAVVINL